MIDHGNRCQGIPCTCGARHPASPRTTPKTLEHNHPRPGEHDWYYHPGTDIRVSEDSHQEWMAACPRCRAERTHHGR